MDDTFDDGSDIFGDATEPVPVAILGSTGSIGTQALEVVRAHPDRFRVTALTANSDAETLLAQAKEFDVHLLGLTEGAVEAPGGATVVDGAMASAEVAEIPEIRSSSLTQAHAILFVKMHDRAAEHNGG